MTNIKTAADTLGFLTAEKKALETRIAALKAELVEYGDTVVGYDFTVSQVAGSATWTLDRKLVEEEMGETWVTAHSKISNRNPTVRIARNIAAAA